VGHLKARIIVFAWLISLLLNCDIASIVAFFLLSQSSSKLQLYFGSQRPCLWWNTEL